MKQFWLVIVVFSLEATSTFIDDNHPSHSRRFPTQIQFTKSSANVHGWLSTILKRIMLKSNSHRENTRESQQRIHHILWNSDRHQSRPKHLFGNLESRQQSKHITGGSGSPHLRKKRIVGGNESKQGSWPWQVALFLNGTQQCAGSLIDRYWIVTAAHCVLYPNDTTSKPHLWSATLGEHRLDYKETFEQIKSIEKIVAHSNFSFLFDQQGGRLLYVDYDVALFKLQTPANFTKYVNPIRLLTENMTFPTGKECYVTGWGHTNFNGTQPSTLHEVKLKLVSHTVCNSNISYGGYIHDVALCAGLPEGGVGSCQFDSGGPLSCDDEKGRFYLTGVVSWGFECARPYKYDVFANMMLLTSWVKKKIIEVEKCNGTRAL